MGNGEWRQREYKGRRDGSDYKNTPNLTKAEIPIAAQRRGCEIIYQNTHTDSPL